MHELVCGLVDQRIAQLGVPIQEYRYIGIYHAQKGSRIGALPAAHIAVIQRGLDKQILQQTILLQDIGHNRLARFAVR